MQVVTIRDISFIKELEKERLLRVQLKAIMETMITLNHKINNDLQNIMGKSEILMDKLKNSSTDIYDSLNTINNSAENIASVILKLSKVVRPISTFYTNETSMLDLEASIDSK
jgi:nitrogen-specific signal transduction histidine kinase